MPVLRECLRRLWGALRRNPADRDLERELRFHLEQAEEELRAKGCSPAEAARLARVCLGGLPQAMEALRDQRGWPWLDDLRTDVRIGLRGLARRPGFAATAVLTLSIGIGATAAVATVTNALLFQPLPVPDPDELVVVTQLDEHTSVFPHATVLSRIPRLPGAQRRLRRSGRAHPGARVAVDRRSRGGADLDRVRQRQLLRCSAVERRAWPHVPPRGRAPSRRCAVRRVGLSRMAVAVRRGSGCPWTGRSPRAGEHDRHRDHAGGLHRDQRPGACGVVRPRHRGRARRAGVDGAVDQPAPGVVRADRTPAARRDGRRGGRPARRPCCRAGRGASGCERPQRALRHRRACRETGPPTHRAIRGR